MRRTLLLAALSGIFFLWNDGAARAQDSGKGRTGEVAVSTCAKSALPVPVPAGDARPAAGNAEMQSDSADGADEAAAARSADKDLNDSLAAPQPATSTLSIPFSIPAASGSWKPSESRSSAAPASGQ